jgi:hypothetical protein
MPTPVADNRGRFAVEPAGNGARIVWESSFVALTRLPRPRSAGCGPACCQSCSATSGTSSSGADGARSYGGQVGGQRHAVAPIGVTPARGGWPCSTTAAGRPTAASWLSAQVAVR